RRPPSRSGDVVLLLPRPALVGPPVATSIAATFDEPQVGGVRDRGLADPVAAHIGLVLGALVVVGEAVRRSADHARTGRDVDQVEPTILPGWLASQLPEGGRERGHV